MNDKQTLPLSKKIAIYARKSKATETGKSIENQISKCSQYAFAKLNATEADLLVFQDYGLSGFYADRPAYQSMMEAISEGTISAVLCYKIDRISRKTIDLLNFIELLKQKNIAFISCTDDIDTQSKTGKIMLSLLASIAEFERDIITERITDNLYELAKEGRWLGGNTPLGYKSEPRYTYVNGKKSVSHDLKIIPEEATIVHTIYETFCKTRSLVKTATYLEENQFYTRKKQPFTTKAIKSILSNPVYAIADATSFTYLQQQNISLYANQSQCNEKNGFLAYNKTHQTKKPDGKKQGVYKRTHQKQENANWIVTIGKHTGIIPGSEWVRTQTILQDNKNKYRRPKQTSNSLLSEKVRCPICQGLTYVRAYSNRYTTEGNQKYAYVCKEKYQNHIACPHSPNLPGNQLDKMVWLTLAKACCIPIENYRKEINNFLQQAEKNLTQPAQDNRKAQLEKEIKKLSQAIENQITNARTAEENIRPLLLADISQMQKEKEKLETQNHKENLYTAHCNTKEISLLPQRKKELLSYLFQPEFLWQRKYPQQANAFCQLPQAFIHHISIDSETKTISVFLQKENAPD